MHPNKYNNSEGVQRLTLRRKIRLDSSINLKDKMNQSTMSSLNDSIVSSARKQILDSTSSKRQQMIKNIRAPSFSKLQVLK
jgi:hypothetical protein